jgi:hypothetical protein
MNKQFNIKGTEGLYLSHKPLIALNTNNYKNLLIEDYDFFPTNVTQTNLYDFKNARYEDPFKIIGSNSKQSANSVLNNSEITIKDELVANKMYYNTFKLYFRFFGSTISKYILPTVPGTNPSTRRAISKKVLDRLRVKIYVTVGSNEIPMELSNLQKYNGSDWVNVTTADTTGGNNISAGDYGIQIANGLNSEDCIDMAYTGTTIMDNLFNGYLVAPDRYNFRVDASFPDFDQIANSTKTYKIKIKYLNIGVSNGGSIYSVSESVELMSNTFTFYDAVQTPSTIIGL